MVGFVLHSEFVQVALLVCLAHRMNGRKGLLGSELRLEVPLLVFVYHSEWAVLGLAGICGSILLLHVLVSHICHIQVFHGGSKL